MRAYVVDRSAQKPWNAPPEFAATVERNRAEFKAQFGSFEEAEIGPYWLSTSEDGAWLAFQSHRPDGSIHRFALPASMVPQFIVELAGATDPVAGLVLSAPHRVDRLYVGGEEVVRDGRLVRADEEEIARQQRAYARRLAA